MSQHSDHEDEAGSEVGSVVELLDSSSSSESEEEDPRPAKKARTNKGARVSKAAKADNSSKERGHFWTGTWNNPPGVGTKPDDELRWPTPLPADIAGVLYSVEKGENGTVHFQFVLKTSKQVRWAAVKKCYPQVHLEKVENLQACIDYCSKDDETHIAGPFKVGEEVTRAQGRRSDLDEVKTAIKEGMSDGKLYDHFFNTMARYPHLAHHARMAWASKELRDVKVEVYYGVSGSGKSHMAYHENPDAFRKPDAGQWYDGYQVNIRISQPNMHNIYEE